MIEIVRIEAMIIMACAKDHSVISTILLADRTAGLIAVQEADPTAVQEADPTAVQEAGPTADQEACPSAVQRAGLVDPEADK